MAWLKWHIGSASDPKFRVIAKHANVKISDALAVWMIILEYAYEHEGYIDGLAREISEAVLSVRLDKIDAIITAMNELSMLDGDRVANWAERQALPERLEINRNKTLSNAERQRRHREKIQSENNDRNESVTESNAACNENVTEDSLNCVTGDVTRNVTRNTHVTERNERRNENVTKCNAPLKEKEEEEEEEEDIKNPPTPQGGSGGKDASVSARPEQKDAREKKQTGNSLTELREAMRCYTSSPPLLETLEEFRLMRERIRKPMTGRALKLIFGKLDELSANQETAKIEILNQSILNSWQDLYPLKNRGDCRAIPNAVYQRRGEMSLAQRNYQTAMSVIADLEREKMERAS